MKATVNTMAAAIIGRRVYGPFREEGGLPGERAAMRLDTAARVYQWNRRVRGMGAARALELAIPYALRPHTVRAPQWYGPRGQAGQAWQESGDSMRWLDGYSHLGLRLVGYADELLSGVRHTGWYADCDQSETLRGAVWQLPGRKGRARFVYGYVEFEGREELNPDSAAVCVSDILSLVRKGEDSIWNDQTDSDECRDAARYADGMAESVAETRRDDREAYNAGRDAAERHGEAIEARDKARAILSELREAKRGPIYPPLVARIPVIRAELCARIAGLLEMISEKRAARDRLWSECPSCMESSWLAGFIDYADNGQAVARAMGWIKGELA